MKILICVLLALSFSCSAEGLYVNSGNPEKALVGLVQQLDISTQSEFSSTSDLPNYTFDHDFSLVAVGVGFQMMAPKAVGNLTGYLDGSFRIGSNFDDSTFSQSQNTGDYQNMDYDDRVKYYEGVFGAGVYLSKNIAVGVETFSRRVKVNDSYDYDHSNIGGMGVLSGFFEISPSLTVGFRAKAGLASAETSFNSLSSISEERIFYSYDKANMIYAGEIAMIYQASPSFSVKLSGSYSKSSDMDEDSGYDFDFSESSSYKLEDSQETVHQFGLSIEYSF